MPSISSSKQGESSDQWRTYEEFAPGIDTYRKPNVDLSGTAINLTLDDDTTVDLAFEHGEVVWSAHGTFDIPDDTRDPYDAVAVRDDIIYCNLPLRSRERASYTFVFSTTTHRALAVHSFITDRETDNDTRVQQNFWGAVTGNGMPTGDVPGASRDLIGMRNLYRYSPEHLYEHIYVSSQRYAWQNLQGVQRGHGDMDLCTVWKFEHGIYLFCFREFRIAVASVWLHDLGYELTTTGNFLGLNAEGESEHSRAGGYIYPLGSVRYPDVQPI